MAADAVFHIQMLRGSWKVSVEEEEEGLKEPDGSGTPQVHGPHNQLTGTPLASQKSGSLMS